MDRFIDLLNVYKLWADLQNFLEQGGVILVVIMLTTFILWLLIIERYYFFWVLQKSVDRIAVAAWASRKDRISWFALQIRNQLLSIAKMKMENNLAIINLIVVVAPLLGLLGTVTGMMDVFDVMATTGAGNARGMASGVSKSTIPTMAGMVVSLSGVLFSVSLKKKAQTCFSSMRYKMPMAHEVKNHE